MHRHAAARSLALALALGAAAAAPGCRRDPDAPPSCGMVAAKFMYLAELDLARSAADEPTLRAVRAQLPAMRDALATACSDSQWTAEVRRCLHAAEDHVGFETCQQGLTEAQRRALDRSSRGEVDPR